MFRKKFRLIHNVEVSLEGPQASLANHNFQIIHQEHSLAILTLLQAIQDHSLAILIQLQAIHDHYLATPIKLQAIQHHTITRQNQL